MSCYIVSQSTAGFITNAAINYGIIKRSEAIDFANMIMLENQKSVEECYPHRKDVGLIYIFTDREELGIFDEYHPAQVSFSCKAFSYQACEHPTWKDSKTFKLINDIQACADLITVESGKFLEDDDMVWGAPAPVMMMLCAVQESSEILVNVENPSEMVLTS